MVYIQYIHFTRNINFRKIQLQKNEAPLHFFDITSIEKSTPIGGPASVLYDGSYLIIYFEEQYD